VSRYTLIAGSAIPAAIALYVVELTFPEEQRSVWQGATTVALFAVLFVGIAAAILDRRHRR
jgi:hypothetical protein